MMPYGLRDLSVTHVREDLSSLTGLHTDEAFYKCKFEKLNGLTLENCVLAGSSFDTAHVRDALGFTLTLDCFSFSGVRWSTLLFDLFLCLAASSEGNDEKRAKLIDVVGRERFEAISRTMRCTE